MSRPRPHWGADRAGAPGVSGADGPPGALDKPANSDNPESDKLGAIVKGAMSKAVTIPVSVVALAALCVFEIAAFGAYAAWLLSAAAH